MRRTAKITKIGNGLGHLLQNRMNNFSYCFKPILPRQKLLSLSNVARLLFTFGVSLNLYFNKGFLKILNLVKNMSTLTLLGLLAIGIAAGYFSGLVGIGGGVIIVPALVLLFGFSQYAAQGTTLAMLVPPIGIFAVYKYYQNGYVDIKTAAIICIGFMLGSYLGGSIAVNLPQGILRKTFSVLLIVLGIKMFLSK